MNKVNCTNGHFFDSDRYNCCPICGGGIAGCSESKKSKTPVESIHPSRLDNVDKTTLLDEGNSVGKEPESGRAGGIMWRFRQKGQKTAGKVQEQEQHQPKPVSTAPQEIPADKNDSQEELEKKLSDQQATDEPEKNKAETLYVPETEPEKSSLVQAVAATGHSMPSALPKTVAYYEFTEVEPPTGWLICVKGFYQGQAFMCKAGRNRVGRNPNCDISLTNDNSITREPHAILIYDPKQRLFYLQNGTGDGLVYLNGSLLFTHEQLHAYDRIQIGKAEFVFLPLCGEQFTWDDHMS